MRDKKSIGLDMIRYITNMALYVHFTFFTTILLSLFLHHNIFCMDYEETTKKLIQAASTNNKSLFQYTWSKVAEDREFEHLKKNVLTTKDPEVVRAAQKHNETIALIAVPRELSDNIFHNIVDISQSIDKNIKNILALTATCTNFDKRLEHFGLLLKSYSNESKRKSLVRALRYYPLPVRRGFLLMICSGINSNHQQCVDLLERAIRNQDVRMTNLLFKNGTNPDLICKYLDIPHFFKVSTSEMAAVFANNNAHLNIATKIFPNVLYYCFKHHYWSSNFDKIIEFYLSKEVNPGLLNVNNGQCLLHEIVKQFSVTRYETTKKPYIKAMQHILNATKNQINTIDNKGNTPLDILIKKMPKEKLKYGDYKKDILSIIFLLRLNGAQTAQELKEIEAEKLVKTSLFKRCVLCSEEQVWKGPCKDKHLEKIYVPCFCLAKNIEKWRD